MAYNRAQGDESPRRRGGIRRRKKVCIFCGKDKVIERIENALKSI